ncbi:MAG: hypothetical protein ACKO0Z_19700 [Betaproteobacteria bacterium]
MASVMKEDDDKGGEEIIIVEDESKLSANGADDNSSDEDQEDNEDERTKSSADEDEGDGNDDEREAIRERRRLEKLERKERRDQAIKRDKLELDFLRKRNEDLERRVTAQEQRAHQVDLSTFDAQIANAAKEAEMADRVIAKAVEAGNGSDVAQALKYRDQAMQKMQQLQLQKQQAAQQRPQGQQLDDMTMHYAKEFMDANPWYDSQGRDEDSAIVIAIDQSLAKDGYNPQSEEYWDELRKRAARRLPERFKTERRDTRESRETREERTPRGGPAVGSGREHAPATTRKEIYVSPERKQALIDAGVWDDPVLRMKYVKRYAEYDRNNKA